MIFKDYRLEVRKLGIISVTAALFLSGCSLTDRKSETIDAEHDFGVARQDSVVRHTFTLKNTARDPLRVTELTTSCGCTIAGVKPGSSVPAHGVLEVPVELNLAGKEGWVWTTVAINIEGADKPTVFSLKGRVFEEHPATVVFGKVLKGERVERRFQLRGYPGQAPLEITGIKFNDRILSAYAGKSDADPGVYDVRVQLRGDIPFGQIESGIVLNTNDREAPDKKVRVTGYVMRPVEIEPIELLLGVLSPGEQNSAFLELSSPYGKPLRLLGVENSRPVLVTWKMEPNSTDSVKRVLISASGAVPADVPAGTIKTELTFRMESDGAEYRERVEVYALKK